MKTLLQFFLIALFFSSIESIGEVVYAVNCGSGAHTDLHGVHYQADRLSVGTASDYGKSLQIERSAPADQILYQTERYHVADFGYTVPIKDEGEFVLVLKFSEVYFRGSKLKVSRYYYYGAIVESLTFMQESVFLVLPNWLLPANQILFLSDYPWASLHTMANAHTRDSFSYN